MVEFGGWDMPLHYGSQIDEHHVVRRSAGMFDVSHMLSVDIGGPSSLTFLRRLLANDPAKLHGVGAAQYTCMLNDQGGVVDDLIVSHSKHDQYRIVLNAATADSDVAWIEARRSADGYAATVHVRRDLAMIAVQGPQAREIVWNALPETRALTQSLAPFQMVDIPLGRISRTGYTGEDGFEITVPAATASSLWDSLQRAGAVPCGLGARDTLRLEAGMNLYGADMDLSTTPFESGLGWTVDLRSARDFVGRRAIEGVRVSRVRFGACLLGRGVLRGGMLVHSAGGTGVVTSGTFSPTLGCAIGLVRLPRPSGGQDPEAGHLVDIEIRGTRMPARLVDPPFVRRGEILINLNNLPKS